MKTLTKLLVAALLTIFTATILSTPTYAASTVDVYCDGVDDQDKIEAVLADDTIINIHNDCAFTDNLYISFKTGVVLQGDGNATSTFDSQGGGESLVTLENSSVTINDMKIVRFIEGEGGIDWAFDFAGDGNNLYLNNVTLDSFNLGILINSSDNTVIATNLNIINNVMYFIDDIPELPLNAAIGLTGDSRNNVINWISGQSDVDVAVALLGYSEADISDIAKDFTIGGNVLSGDDFEELWDVIPFFVTVTCINQFVNNGFTAGSAWNCSDTDGGTEEPDGGDNGNEIEAPGTGIGNSINTAIIITSGLLVMGCGIAVVRRTQL